ncbi:MAG TPA: polysaccharide deacetylase family protein [Polyangiales bacterium]|jgi:peptidoglycan/xylan/chitin deacetylase (PgdA/CDA1 family)|nr:polysaccharide deacetylase family protein [Polyangiales bacterium]
MAAGTTRALALAAACLCALTSAFAASQHDPHGLGSAFAPGGILHGATKHRLLHFTFDDGPDAATTPQMLDALDATGIKATFFFSASRFADKSQRNAHARELALEVKKRGHAIGSHSVDHQRMRGMTELQLRHQLDESDRLFTEVFGERTFLFRPPWGSHSPALDRMLAERSATMVLWNIGGNDWSIYDADKLQTTFEHALPYLERTRGWGGGILLFHDTHPWTVTAIPRIIADLRAKNCQLLDTTQELYDITDDLALWDPSLDPAALEAEVQRRQAELRSSTRERCKTAPP